MNTEPAMPIGEQYSIEEWREIVRQRFLPRGQRRAPHATPPPLDLGELFQTPVRGSASGRGMERRRDWVARVPWAMFVWYGLLYAVIAGSSSRGIRYGGELAKDVRILREPLRDARNAVFHVERDVDYYDDRFPGIVRQSAVQLTREHKRPEFAQSQASPFVKPKSSALLLSRARNATKSDAGVGARAVSLPRRARQLRPRCGPRLRGGGCRVRRSAARPGSHRRRRSRRRRGTPDRTPWSRRPRCCEHPIGTGSGFCCWRPSRGSRARARHRPAARC